MKLQSEGDQQPSGVSYGAKLFVRCSVANPSLQFSPCNLFGFIHGDEVGVWLIVWIGDFYTGSKFKQVQLIQVMSGGLLKDKLAGLREPAYLLVGTCQILCNNK